MKDHPATIEADRINEAGDRRMEKRTLREETVLAGRYLQVIGGRIVHLIEAEYDLQARHLAHEVIQLGKRMETRGSSSDAA